MPPANVEGNVAAHALSVVFQQLTVDFVCWELMVPSWGSSLCENPARLSAMDVTVGVGTV